MFRPQIVRRSFSLIRNVHTPGRQILNSALRDGNDVIRIQRVRFARPPYFSRRRIAEQALYLAGAYAVFRYIWDVDEDEEPEGPQREHLRQSRQKGQPWQGVVEGVETRDQEEDDEEDRDVLLSIPIGFPRPKEPEFYSERDPEWQEFVKISTDTKRLTNAINFLVHRVREYAAEMPNIKNALGPIDTSKGSYMVYHSFPNGPPLEYERSVLEVDENFEIYVTSEPVHEQHYQRFNQVAYPTAALLAAYELSKTQALQGWRSIKSYAGYPESRTRLPSDIIHVKIKNKGKQSSGEPTRKSSADAPTQSASSSAAPSSTATTGNASSQQSTKPAPGDQLTSTPPTTLEKFNPPIAVDPSRFTMHIGPFRANLRRAVGPRPFIAPRGTFFFTGTVEIVGTRGFLIVDVGAAYDPRTDSFVRIDFRLLKHQPFKIAALKK